jgi:hypothetical protein|tara:strand:- start:461 stop:658 length:198 start_codon:yes stop_codon:yes gene_type:complete
MTKEQAYEKLDLEDVLAASRFIKWGLTPGSGKVEAIKYVEYWKAWTKENDTEAYNKIMTVKKQEQ